MLLLSGRINRILNDLKEQIYSKKYPVSSFLFKEGNFKNEEEANNHPSPWKEFNNGDSWEGKDKHYWFKTTVKIPKEFSGKTVVFQVKTGREGQWDATNPQFLIYVNGILVQGLDVNHTEIVLSQNAKAEEIFDISLHAYTGMIGGKLELSAHYCVFEADVEQLYFNINVPLQVAECLDKEDKKRIDIINFLNQAVNMLDLRKPFSPGYRASINKANDYLEKEFYGKYCGNSDAVAHCVGHTHIDVAWLWTLAQTKEKCARSFSTVLNLMEQYPEYIFMSSQPQLYKFVKENYPDLYEKIKSKVKEGKWEPEGAMWVEADCNVASGESLVRQILFGSRFFEKEFGVKNKILWLPDVFGYSAALPQILKKSGIDYFMTTKISWNEYNQIPYDTFMWKGIDGTEILTHFITTKDIRHKDSFFTTYVGKLDSYNVMGAWQRYQQKDLSDEILICYGYGDGGGGPTKDMLENARRLSKGIPGCPKVKLGNSLDYFKQLESKISTNPKLPKWVGELYLEYHRGTYTSMAQNKKYNRKSEYLYQDAEWLCSLNYLTDSSKLYPQKQLNDGWETILLNQFHDILPGSSIKEVYEDSKKDYIKIISKGKELLEDAINNITAKINLSELSIVVFNQLSFNRDDLVECLLPKEYENAEIFDTDGTLLPSQLVTEFGENGQAITKILFFAKDVPAKGYKAFRLRKSGKALESVNNKLYISNKSIKNKYFNIDFDENANICSIYDKINQRQVLKVGQKANLLQTFEDKPIQYDAWDINIYYQEKMWEIDHVENIEVIEEGPVRAGLQIKRKYLDSTIVQTIYVYSDIPRIDFKTWIDWKESQILLKAAFPIDVNTDKATYEIQYGNVERPTHWNTSWDTAKFEVCAHKWVDLSEDNYGVSLINDCKYGHDIKDGLMRLTLLKSANYPNPEADKEIHEFTYSLYPHAGNWKKAATTQMAYALNCPMYAKIEMPHSGNLPSELSLVQVDSNNVIVEVIKKAEDSDHIVIRLYECYNRRSHVSIKLFKNISEVWESDLMENNINKLKAINDTFQFEIYPYEIKTFKVKLK